MNMDDCSRMAGPELLLRQVPLRECAGKTIAQIHGPDNLGRNDWHSESTMLVTFRDGTFVFLKVCVAGYGDDGAWIEERQFKGPDDGDWITDDQLVNLGLYHAITLSQHRENQRTRCMSTTLEHKRHQLAILQREVDELAKGT